MVSISIMMKDMFWDNICRIPVRWSEVICTQWCTVCISIPFWLHLGEFTGIWRLTLRRKACQRRSFRMSKSRKHNNRGERWLKHLKQSLEPCLPKRYLIIWRIIFWAKGESAGWAFQNCAACSGRMNMQCGILKNPGRGGKRRRKERKEEQAERNRGRKERK